MFCVNLQRAEHTKHYSIQPLQVPGVSGWEVRLEEDRELRRCARDRDWLGERVQPVTVLLMAG